jgi:3-oxoacyl-[acyl-carrier-protein] synthase-1
MSNSLHIVALGARTPVGLTAETSAAAIRAGICRLWEHPYLVSQRGDGIVMGLDGVLDPQIAGVERVQALAEVALREILMKLRIPTLPLPAIDVLLGLPEPRPGLEAPELEQMTLALGRRLAGEGVARVYSLPLGHAAALEALRQAVTRIRGDQASLCIVGGADSYSAPETLIWLESNRQLVGPETRLGFIPGEGAAFLAVASEELRARLDLPSLAELVNVSTARETKLIKSDAINLGEGLSAAIVGATEMLHLPEEQIDDVYCDINGERYRSEEWGFAVLRAQRVLRNGGAYTTLVSECGDLGAASTAMAAVLAVQAGRRSYAQGPRALLWGSSEGGLRAAALLLLKR